MSTSAKPVPTSSKNEPVRRQPGRNAKLPPIKEPPKPAQPIRKPSMKIEKPGTSRSTKPSELRRRSTHLNGKIFEISFYF